MGRETILFKNEQKMSNMEAADLLRQIADKIERGKVTLVQGKKEVKLKVPGRVEVEVKAEKEEGKNRTKKKIEVEVEWVVGDSTKGGGPMVVK